METIGVFLDNRSGAAICVNEYAHPRFGAVPRRPSARFTEPVLKRRARVGCSDAFLPPSRPAEKASARQDETGQTGTGNGAGGSTDGIEGRRIVVSLKAALRRSAAQHKLSDGFPRTGLHVEVVCELRRDAKE